MFQPIVTHVSALLLFYLTCKTNILRTLRKHKPSIKYKINMKKTEKQAAKTVNIKALFLIVYNN